MTEPPSNSDPSAAFPALRRLGARLRARQIPFVQQMEVAECGAACLAMVLGYYGRDVRLSELREVTGTDRDGVSALALLETARRYGLRGRGLRVENVSDLQYVDPAAVLHFGLNHFVVFQRLTDGDVEFLDPKIGRRRLSADEFSKHFTGVVLSFEPGEDFTPQAGNRRRASRYTRALFAHAGVLTQVVVTSLLIQLLALALPLLTSVLIDRVVPRNDHHLLTVLGVGALAVVVFTLLTGLVRAHLLLHLRTHLDARLTLSFVEHLVSLPYAFFQKRSAGDLIMRLNSNATIREVLTTGTLSGLLDGTLVLLYLVILFITSAFMGWIVVGLAVLQAAIFLLTRQKYRELMAQELEAQAKSQSYEVQLLAGIETLKSGGSEQRATQRWSNLFVDVLNVSLKRGRMSALVDALLSTLRIASPLLVLWVGGFQVLAGQMTLGTLFAINALAAGFLLPFSSLISTALQLATVKSYIERIDDVLESPPEQDRQAVSRAPQLTGRITLENVSFRYGPLAPLVVKDVSVDIQPGRHVAIAGRSGSGKSTLARLLVGLHIPTEGRVAYDGIGLTGLDFQSVRTQVGLVPQVPFLFGTTIRENIALTQPDATLAEIEAAARRAHIHDDIAAMPMGYDTLLADGGASLSGGQRQRLTLARALVDKPAILVLDEATSDLDTITESAIQRELESLRCTTITIAHRLSTIRRADLILVLENGESVERGTHDELMKLGGQYASLVAAQMDGGRDRPAG